MIAAETITLGKYTKKITYRSEGCVFSNMENMDCLDESEGVSAEFFNLDMG